MKKATLKHARQIWEQARIARNDRGIARLDAKTVAKMVRERLRVEFPGVKFSVRTDCNSIRVGWTDGPYEKQVDRVAQDYSFGGFDGMIDLAYSSNRWLLPDGRLEFCSTSGTEGSRGTVPAVATDCPEPGAVMVDSYVKYVFTQRERSDEYLDKLARETCGHWGGMEYDPSKKPWDHPVRQDLRHGGVWCLMDLMNRYEADKARQLIEALELLHA